jgi:hypothetical protein
LVRCTISPRSGWWGRASFYVVASDGGKLYTNLSTTQPGFVEQ